MNNNYYYPQTTQNPHPVYMDYDGWNNIRNSNRDRALAKFREERRKKAAYYSEQRAFGLLVFIVGVVVIGIGAIADIDLMQYAGLAGSLFGIYTMASKHMILRNSYYFEVQDKINLC